MVINDDVLNIFIESGILRVSNWAIYPVNSQKLTQKL